MNIVKINENLYINLDHIISIQKGVWFGSLREGADWKVLTTNGNIYLNDDEYEIIRKKLEDE